MGTYMSDEELRKSLQKYGATSTTSKPQPQNYVSDDDLTNTLKSYGIERTPTTKPVTSTNSSNTAKTATTSNNSAKVDSACAMDTPGKATAETVTEFNC